MKKCPSCGSEMKENAKFCGVCGVRFSIPTDTEPMEDDAASTSDIVAHDSNSKVATNTDAEPTPMSENETGQHGAVASLAQEDTPALSAQKVSLSALLGLKTVKIGIASIAAIVLACIVFFLMRPNLSVPEDVVKNALKTETSIMSGIIQSEYVNESEYELTEFSVDSQKVEDQKVSGTNASMGFVLGTVTFSGTVKNESFETQFTGTGSFTKMTKAKEAEWTPADITIEWTQTKPLKGVDSMGDETEARNTVITDFSSTFEESNGSYTSTAQRKATYAFWFAEDSCTESQTYIFDKNQGWISSGDKQTSNRSTKYLFDGKSFVLSEESANPSFPAESRSSTVTFAGGDGGSLSASYTFDVKSVDMYSSEDYQPISLSGTLVGVVSHDFGLEEFSLNFTDAKNNVTFAVKGSDEDTTEGAEVPKFMADIITKSTWFVPKYGSSDTYSADGLTFVQKI